MTHVAHSRFCLGLCVAILVGVCLGVAQVVAFTTRRLHCDECEIVDPSGQTWRRAGPARAAHVATTQHCECDPKDDHCGPGQYCVLYGDDGIDRPVGRCFERYKAHCPVGPYWRPGFEDNLYCPVCASAWTPQ